MCRDKHIKLHINDTCVSSVMLTKHNLDIVRDKSNQDAISLSDERVIITFVAKYNYRKHLVKITASKQCVHISSGDRNVQHEME